MHLRWQWSTLAAGIAVAFPALAQAAQPAKKIRVAVMEIRALGVEPVKAELLSEVALTEAAGFEALAVIGRSDIAAMIGLERQKQLLGCDEGTCLAELGGALGADLLLTGSLGRLGALYRLDLKLVDARGARVVGRQGESVTGEEEKLVAAVQRAVRRLLEPVAGTAGRAAGPLPASRFDGAWSVRIRCPETREGSGAKGYVQEFVATVTNGTLRGTFGRDGEPASLHLEGDLQPDGSAMLVANGRTGAAAYAVLRSAPGTPFTYHVKAQFQGERGTGTRLEHRVCTFDFARR